MVSQRTCVDCGRTLVAVVRGRPPTRCGECARGRRRQKTRVAVCLDCGKTFQPAGQTGRLPERCPECSLSRKRITDRAKAKRWREANANYQTEYMRAWHQAHKDNPEYRQRRSDAGLKKRHGLTPEQLRALVESQHGLCAICGGEPNGPGKRLHVDHCHKTGQRRALLCAKCNTMLGLADDTPERLEEGAAYLRRWSESKE